MAWWQLSVQCKAAELEQTETSLLRIGAVSITLSDAKDEPLYESVPGDNPVWQHSLVTGLFDQRQALQSLRNDLAKLLLPHQISSIREAEIADQDWERAHLKYFKPIQCGKNLWVVPSWADPPDPDAINIRLDPGLAFGTGSHPTTALCLAWLSDKNLNDQSVIDYGCGSGILAITACKLGAAHVIAVDIDPQALSATRDNMNRNGIDPASFETCLPERMDLEVTDLLIANILSGPLVELAEKLTSLVKKGGKILLSGILENQLDDITSAYQTYFDLDPVSTREGWISISGSRRQA
ncbi:MAG: 50S ribosomal protein L11 methyltransferase [Gammaproteobacteria bacterium]|nr:MAG: 50S ribosomal protein L11 methyltransferase [Gammaproteobacteria bacterium]